MLAAVTGLLLAAPMTAEPPVAQADNDQYDQYMISHGMVSGAGTNCAPANPNCGQSPEFLLAEGRKACAAFAQGATDMSVTGQLEGSPGPLNPGPSVSLGRAGAENIVPLSTRSQRSYPAHLPCRRQLNTDHCAATTDQFSVAVDTKSE
jgi:hypothetical protein